MSVAEPTQLHRVINTAPTLGFTIIRLDTRLATIGVLTTNRKHPRTLPRKHLIRTRYRSLTDSITKELCKMEENNHLGRP